MTRDYRAYPVNQPADDVVSDIRMERAVRALQTVQHVVMLGHRAARWIFYGVVPCVSVAASIATDVPWERPMLAYLLVSLLLRLVHQPATLWGLRVLQAEVDPDTGPPRRWVAGLLLLGGIAGYSIQVGAALMLHRFTIGGA